MELPKHLKIECFDHQVNRLEQISSIEKILHFKNLMQIHVTVIT